MLLAQAMETHAPLLGQKVASPTQYAPEILCPIKRTPTRLALRHEPDSPLPFVGHDGWTCYEFSWLNLAGKPCIAVLQCNLPADSPYFIESKSFKLYLQSFADCRLASLQCALATVQKDLEACIQAPCQLVGFEPKEFPQSLAPLPGFCLDDLEVEIDNYVPNPKLLRWNESKIVQEVVHSNLLKSNCPVTQQPDFGSIIIDYHGPAIDHASLLRYLVAYRHHLGFHEQCVELMFMDIWRQCQPKSLTIIARYTRRGGLDINPLRSSHGGPYPHNERHYRQ